MLLALSFFCFFQDTRAVLFGPEFFDGKLIFCEFGGRDGTALVLRTVVGSPEVTMCECERDMVQLREKSKSRREGCTVCNIAIENGETLAGVNTSCQIALQGRARKVAHLHYSSRRSNCLFSRKMKTRIKTNVSSTLPFAIQNRARAKFLVSRRDGCCSIPVFFKIEYLEQKNVRHPSIDIRARRILLTGYFLFVDCSLSEAETHDRCISFVHSLLKVSPHAAAWEGWKWLEPDLQDSLQHARHKYHANILRYMSQVLEYYKQSSIRTLKRSSMLAMLHQAREKIFFPNNTRGWVFACSNKFLNTTQLAAQNLRIWTQLPIVLFTDAVGYEEQFDKKVFNDVFNVETFLSYPVKLLQQRQKGFRLGKIAAMLLSPFETSFFFDSDIWACGHAVNSLFDAMENCSSSLFFVRDEDSDEVVNGGSIGFKLNFLAQAFLLTWMQKYVLAVLGKGRRDGVGVTLDQPPLQASRRWMRSQLEDAHLPDIETFLPAELVPCRARQRFGYLGYVVNANLYIKPGNMQREGHPSSGRGDVEITEVEDISKVCRSIHVNPFKYKGHGGPNAPNIWKCGNASLLKKFMKPAKTYASVVAPTIYAEGFQMQQ